MQRKVLPLLVISLSGLAWLPIPTKAIASTPLTRAIVQDIYNLVQLMPQNRPKRQARRADAMIPGDGLSTGRSSLAQLRFNDGSLARVGEQAVFRFLPQTRNFRLSNGTVLLLIPPGRGTTRVRTPSAAAAVRGSALFLRYDEKTDTTIVGALTNSGIEVFDKDEANSHVLKAGQMMLVVKGKLKGLYDFDLRQFYETSDLVRGLELNNTNPTIATDAALDSVRVETTEALNQQKPVTGEGVITNPTFAQLSTDTSTASTTPSNNNQDSTITSKPDSSDSIDPANRRQSRRVRETPVNNPPVNQTPINQPPTPSEPPVNQPPTSQPESPTQPPVNPPTQPESPTQPPISQPPSSQPPINPPTKPESPVNPPPSSQPPINPPTKPESPVNPPPSSQPPVNPPTKPESPVNPPTQPESPVNPPPSSPPPPINQPPSSQPPPVNPPPSSQPPVNPPTQSESLTRPPVNQQPIERPVPQPQPESPSREQPDSRPPGRLEPPNSRPEENLNNSGASRTGY
ncbi:FecR domain-containing protein [Calothrix sp. NIES-3974]|uniref:FecR domain-containing protein n=1 Tax=Calothrix sp. NIES-3974 TaxID=2005462 RepID=UPI000B615995|nr:FecR domain-containing protein [Calothrix sp. NIES-3974]BAZ07622.1 hypothetical protein NIES3974_42860 [Calothrix sp. NIES-3974]